MALLLAATLVPACSGEEASTTTTTTSTTTKASKDFNVATPDGQVSLSLDDKLPPGWPEGFPVPGGATPAGSGSLGGTDSTLLVGVYTTGTKPEQAFDFYRSSSKLTTANPSSLGSGSAFLGTIEVTGPQSGRVTVMPGGDGSYIIITLDAPGATGGTGSTATTAGTASTTSTTPSSSSSTSSPANSPGGPA